jgi:hypothetical protein
MRPRPTLLYSLALPVVVAFTFWLTTWAFDLTDGWPWPELAGWTIVALNVVPPAVAGGISAIALACVALRLRWFLPSLRGHLARLALLYPLCALLAGYSAIAQRSSDFGLWGQILEWPLTAFLGLAVVDAVTTLMVRHQARGAA